MNDALRVEGGQLVVNQCIKRLALYEEIKRVRLGPLFDPVDQGRLAVESVRRSQVAHVRNNGGRTIAGSANSQQSADESIDVLFSVYRRQINSLYHQKSVSASFEVPNLDPPSVIAGNRPSVEFSGKSAQGS